MRAGEGGKGSSEAAVAAESYYLAEADLTSPENATAGGSAGDT